MPTAPIRNRLLRYPALLRDRRKLDRRHVPSHPQGGYFRREFLTPLGAACLARLRDFVPRPADYRGANRAGFYVKYLLGTDRAELTALLVAADALRELLGDPDAVTVYVGPSDGGRRIGTSNYARVPSVRINLR